MKLIIDNKEVNVNLTRKNRKTISIKISKNCEVNISAPIFIDDEKIIELIKNKEQWIIQSLRQIEQKRKEILSYKDGVMYIGTRYPLNIHKVKHSSLKLIFDKSSFNIYIPETLTEEEEIENIKELITKWYKLQSRKVFQERVNYYSSKLKISPNRIAIKDQKSRWGSCSSKGNINLNYRLVMAPIEIIDYVIVHELCHLLHLNHSKDFWALVEKTMPSYLKCKEWLKINGNTLSL